MLMHKPSSICALTVKQNWINEIDCKRMKYWMINEDGNFERKMMDEMKYELNQQVNNCSNWHIVFLP
jgi:hypothetical protein